MTIDPEKILYAVLGATLIKRQARLRREVEKIMCENKSIRSIVLQGIDAAYITFRAARLALPCCTCARTATRCSSAIA